MYTVFVTGSLASGKRSACLYLAEQGFTHIDLDDMAKEFLNEELVQRQIMDVYGDDLLDETDGINRSLLAKRAFASEESTAALNGIIWPLVNERLANLIVGNSCQFRSSEDRLVVEIAMLAEGLTTVDLADAVLCITADEGIRIERALARGMELADIKNRMALQASDEERAQICDVIIENNGSLAQLHEKLASWLESQQQEQMF